MPHTEDNQCCGTERVWLARLPSAIVGQSWDLKMLTAPIPRQTLKSKVGDYWRFVLRGTFFSQIPVVGHNTDRCITLIGA